MRRLPTGNRTIQVLKAITRTIRIQIMVTMVLPTVLQTVVTVEVIEETSSTNKGRPKTADSLVLHTKALQIEGVAIITTTSIGIRTNAVVQAPTSPPTRTLRKHPRPTRNIRHETHESPQSILTRADRRETCQMKSRMACRPRTRAVLSRQRI